MKVDKYRIREAIVSHCDGYRSQRRRMFIAERRLSLFGFPLFFPCVADWRHMEEEAFDDIERDRDLRRPIPPPRLIGDLGGKRGGIMRPIIDDNGARLVDDDGKTIVGVKSFKVAVDFEDALRCFDVEFYATQTGQILLSRGNPKGRVSS